MPPPPAGPGFARTLGLFDATMIAISGIIGSGIFINPAVVARTVETPVMILAVWGAGGLIALLGAFVFAELSSAPRVYYAMAADGLFFRALARLSPRFKVPTAAILLQGAIAAVLALTSSYDRLLGYAVFADWVFFALSGVALLVFRRKLPGAPRPYPTPGYPWVPLVFTLAACGIVLNTYFADTHNALIGTAIFAAGVPVYFLWRGRQRTP